MQTVREAMEVSKAIIAPPVRLAAIPATCPLTPRELDVLRLMGEGLTTKAIAERLNVRFKTAACHRNRILQKLDVNSSVSAVLWAVREGIIPL